MRGACAALIALVALAGACQRGDATPRNRSTPTPLDPAQTGTITGTVRFTGAKPAPRTVDPSSDPTCAKLHPSGIVVDPIDVTDARVANVLVYVAHGLEDRVFALPQEPVVIDQRGCTYVPRVAGVRAGQPIHFVNSDDTLHNVHGEPVRSSPWNFGLSQRGADRLLVLAQPEVAVPVRCDVHPWMRAYVGVFDHPYFAITGADGRYTLPQVPAGEIVVATWHERLGPQETTVTVTPGSISTVDFELRLDRMDARP